METKRRLRPAWTAREGASIRFAAAEDSGSVGTAKVAVTDDKRRTTVEKTRRVRSDVDPPTQAGKWTSSTYRKSGTVQACCQWSMAKSNEHWCAKSNINLAFLHTTPTNSKK